jgi:serine-type D-Ala-D-Ala carboxypeptidase/endopeptidase
VQQVGKKSYGDLLKREVLSPLQLDHTSFNAPPWKEGCSDDSTQNLFGGHKPDGNPWPRTQPDGTPSHDSTPRGASGLYSTPEDLLKWLQWHLETGADLERIHTEARLLNHATYVQRDGLKPVLGLDESGHMDAMGLGWVVMMPKGDRPFILQKAGGTNGVFSYIAFSPVRGIGFFMSIDKFDVGAAAEMAQMINDLIASSAPR